jgi:hypothetical protein
MKTKRIGWTALAAALAIGATAFAAPSGASPSWTTYPGGMTLPIAAAAPAAGSHASPSTCYKGLCLYTATMIAGGAVSTGVTAQLNQPRPRVVPGERSVTAIGIGSADGRQSITFGWMISKQLFGDTVPHVVINAAVNGVARCINGCGFVPVVKSEPKVAVGHIGKYTIKLSKGKWLIVFNNKTIGYYPTSLWPGNRLSRSHLAIAFGEVASPSKTSPKSDMGNGKLGTNKASAKVIGLTLLGATGTAQFDYIAVDAPAKYNIGFINGACHNKCSMNYGGPGF